ncbi:MAG: peptidoglycan DD-metalloendopeptidase family protein [Candidatus Kaiserbacteria bacterium]|nr:peptidoglycan DD-metalloendopeptidase family protein [Candidatus Kaiserbacteria bacterium]
MGILALFFVGVIHLQAEGVTINRSVQDGDYEPTETTLIRDNPEIQDLQRQITEQGDRIQKTHEEIEQINNELERVHTRKQTLQNELETLSLIDRQNEVHLRSTEEAVKQSQLKIQSLNSSIADNALNVQLLRHVLQKNYRRKNEFDLQGSATHIFLHPSFFEVLQWAEETGRYTEALQDHLDLLEMETARLEYNREEVLTERDTLESRQQELADRKKIHAFSLNQKRVLVSKTKNDEAVYQQMLAMKKKEFLELQRDLLEYQSRIDYLRDPTRIPDPQPGLLRLPFDGSMPVTQEFGETSFARANSSRYGRPFHNGIDFGTPIGTEILAAADGVIVGVGNTDIVPSCQSWGKWVLIEHPFGLTTMYAHLSLTKVRLGQKVKSGDLIGYSGSTGFSTGPHLHFGVYDSRGIEVVPYERLSQSGRCRGLEIPVAAQDALLNPTLYLDL